MSAKLTQPIHCAWCGKDYPPTNKDRPKQHTDGKKTCPGSGQERRVHDQLNSARKTA